MKTVSLFKESRDNGRTNYLIQNIFFCRSPHDGWEGVLQRLSKTSKVGPTETSLPPKLHAVRINLEEDKMRFQDCRAWIEWGSKIQTSQFKPSVFGLVVKWSGKIPWLLGPYVIDENPDPKKSWFFSGLEASSFGSKGYEKQKNCTVNDRNPNTFGFRT